MKKSIVIRPKEIFLTLLYSIVFFALIKPDSLEYLGLKWLDTMLIVLNVPIMLILIIMNLIKKYKLSIITKSILVMYIIMLFSTIFVSKDLFSYVKMVGPIFVICMFTDYLMQKKTKYYFTSAIFILGLLYTLNFITIIKYYPNGMYSMDKVVGDLYLMGYDNGMIYNLIPLCCISMIYSYVKHNKIFSMVSIFAIFLTLFSEFYVFSASGIVQCVALLVLIILSNGNLIKKFLKPGPLFITFIILTFLIVIFRIQNHFSWLIVDILHKDLTFTNRVFLWDYAIALFTKNPIFGVGISTNMIQGLYLRTYSHPHCLILDILCKGGILMFFAFCTILYNFSKCYKKSNDVKIKNIIFLSCYSILIGEMVNSVPYKVFLWSMLVLICYTDNISKMFNKNRGN